MSTRTATTARLSFWIEPDGHETFEAAYGSQLLPILARHGLKEAGGDSRTGPADVYSRLFELESVDELDRINATLSADTEWGTALAQLGELGAAGGRPPLLSVYSTPAGSGHRRTSSWSGTFREVDGPTVVRGICRARDGSVWCGLDVGVGRFRDNAWDVYTQVNGLDLPAVHHIIEDDEGRMWFGTGYGGWDRFGELGGLSRFDGTSFTAVSLEDGLSPAPVSGIALFEGQVAVATLNGVLLFGRDGLERTITVADGLPRNDVTDIAATAHGLWLSTGSFGDRGDGVSRWDGNRVITYTEESGLPGNRAHCVFSGSEGCTWVAGPTGLSRFDGRRWSAADCQPSISYVHHGAQAGDQLWLADWQAGLLHFDGVSWQDHPGLSAKAVTACDDGEVWALSGGSLWRYQEEGWTTSTATSPNRWSALLIESDGTVWTGGSQREDEGSVSRYDGRQWVSWGHAGGVLDRSVWALLRDRGQRLWIGTLNGLVCFDGDRFDKYTEADGLPGVQILALCEDDAGRLWVGTESGAARLDGDRWTRFTTADGLPHNRVKWILCDREGDLWCATAAGACRFDGSTWQAFSTEDGMAGDYVQMMAQDARGAIWAASFGDATGDARGGGLSRFDGQTWKAFTTEDGLPSDLVDVVFPDPSSGRIWVGTFDEGVACFDGQVFQRVGSGLTWKAVWGIGRDQEGYVWVVGGERVSRYRPATEEDAPSIAVDAVIADRRHEARAVLELPATTQVVAFEFGGSSERTRTDALIYRYRLSGHDDAWKNTAERRVEFEEVIPGTYTFEVMAVDEDLVYSVPAVVELTVRNPLQERIDELEERVRARTRELEEKNEALEAANREIEEANQHKSEFLARMSHDLRTPMNAIIGYARILLRRTKDALEERQYRNLENIQISADNLLRLINEILDLSRIEAGRIEIKPEPVDLGGLVRGCIASLGPLVRPGVELVEELEDVSPVHTDADRIRRVVMNLLGNAVKFTKEGSITVALEPVDQGCKLSVADTGVGIPAEDLPHIFEEFRQVERRVGDKTEGTGLGLAIAARSVELLGGTIAAESEVGVGTTFTVRIGDLPPSDAKRS